MTPSYDVTVYILNHNYSKFLEKSIKSVIGQTYKNFNIIIIDDGSTDNSKSILQKFKFKKNIKIIYQKKIGMIASIIKATKLIKTNFFVRLDADDWMHKDYLKNTMRLMVKNEKLGMVFPDYYEVNSLNKILNKVVRNKFGNDRKLFDFPAHGACTLIRTSCYKKTPGYSKKISAQDGHDIWFKMIEKFQVKNINKPLFYYRKHNNNLTGDLKKILFNRYQILESQNKKIKLINNNVAFVPVLENNENNLLSFKKYKNKKLIDLTLEKVLNSKKISKVFISTNSNKLKNHIRKNYKKKSKKLFFHHREMSHNYSLNDSLFSFIKSKKINKKTNIVLATIEYPLTNTLEIDAAINTLNILKANAVESVVAIKNIFYYSTPKGLKVWGNKILKRERDEIFVRKGGITVIKCGIFLDKRKIIKVPKMAHLLIHPNKGLNYFEIYDFR